MAIEELLPASVEEPIADSAPAEPADDKPVEAAGEEKDAAPKKTKAKAKKPRPAASHPPYLEMVVDAITTLKERTGSSQYAITKFVEDKHKDKLSANFKKLLAQLRNLTASGKLTKVKASYKIPSTARPKPKSVGTRKSATSLPTKAKKAAATKANPLCSDLFIWQANPHLLSRFFQVD
ncbi:hypothetical protein KSP39_PZI015034 [Platanthera zijinensis]|uniref:H15 domain-containing protein n=1 Tax=Platanthera zijinensis TaxID=2320716 RepID=A0AAP0BAH4_9ASPA